MVLFSFCMIQSCQSCHGISHQPVSNMPAIASCDTAFWPAPAQQAQIANHPESLKGKHPIAILSQRRAYNPLYQMQFYWLLHIA